MDQTPEVRSPGGGSALGITLNRTKRNLQRCVEIRGSVGQGVCSRYKYVVVFRPRSPPGEGISCDPP